MKLLISLLLLASATLSADVILTLDQGALIGQPGQTLSFTGSLQNTSGVEQFITSIALNVGVGLNGDTTPFFLSALSVLTPSFSLLPGVNTGSIGLFDIEIPLGTAPGIYSLNNDFALAGGPTGIDFNPLDNSGFSVIVEASAVPEPSSLGLMFAAGLSLVVRRRRVDN